MTKKKLKKFFIPHREPLGYATLYIFFFPWGKSTIFYQPPFNFLILLGSFCNLTTRLLA